MLKGKSLLGYTNLFSPNKYEKNDNIIKKFFLRIDCTKCKKYKEFKKPKISYTFDKILLLSSICNKCGSEDEKILKEKKSIEILKILGLINNT